MRTKEIFGIIVRTFGLSLLIYAIWYLGYGIASAVGYVAATASDLRAYFLTGGVQFLTGLYLLRGASGLMNFAYPENLVEPAPEPDNPDDW